MILYCRSTKPMYAQVGHILNNEETTKARIVRWTEDEKEMQQSECAYQQSNPAFLTSSRKIRSLVRFFSLGDKISSSNTIA